MIIYNDEIIPQFLILESSVSRLLFLVEGVYVLLSTNEIYVRYTYFIKTLNLAQNKKRHFFKKE